MRTLKLYFTGSATANAVAQVIIPSKSVIRAINWQFMLDSIVDNSSAIVEVSKASAREIQVNGSQQCLSEISGYCNFVTSGLYNGSWNLWVPMAIDVIQGQIIYGHAAITGTVNYYATAILHYD
jgi:hypothetical protein